jgi:hypothetical protein
MGDVNRHSKRVSGVALIAPGTYRGVALRESAAKPYRKPLAKPAYAPAEITAFLMAAPA